MKTPAGTRGQIELFRQYALGNFRDLLIEVAKDPAMLVWLDGRTNVRARPQENFARELMELFTIGVGHFEETDVYAGARVFTGWNLTLANRNTAQARYDFFYNAASTTRPRKSSRFRSTPTAGARFTARSAAEGMQDGIDLINAVAAHPRDRPAACAQALCVLRQRSRRAGPGPSRRAGADVLHAGTTRSSRWFGLLLLSPQFKDPSNYYKRYSWPVEFVVRSMKEVGWNGFSVNSALGPLINMGQQLFEPPDVNGWELGPGWFSSGGMLARMNFAALLAGNQRFNLRDETRGKVDSPESLLSFMLDRLTPPEFDSSCVLGPARLHAIRRCLDGIGHAARGQVVGACAS